MGIENPVHLIFLAAVALIVLGPKRLPELARALGKGMREFRGAMAGEGEDEELEHEHPPETSVLPALPVSVEQVQPVGQVESQGPAGSGEHPHQPPAA